MFRRVLDRLSFLCTSGGLLALGFYRGLQFLVLRLDLLTVVVVVVLLRAALTSVVFTVIVGLSGVLFIWKLFRDCQRIDTTTLTGGAVTAIVPVYRDAEVVSRSVRQLRRSPYSDLDIRIVCEPDDRTSIRRACELATAPDVEVLVNTDRPGSKAGAINYAVAVTNSPYVAVFDADEAVHPFFIPRAVATLENGAADVVQGRTVPRPTGPIEAMAYYESVLLSYVARRLVYLLTGFRMAASRAVVMRRDAFEAVGGYDDGTLTEDFEFAYRCYKARLAVREDLAAPSTIEAAHTLRDWWGQRKRWIRGYVQVLGTLLREVRPVVRYRNVLAVLICAGTVGGAPLMLSAVAKFAVLLLVGAEYWVGVPLGVAMGVAALINVVDWVTGAVSRPTPYWVLVPVIFPLYSLVAIKAATDALVRKRPDWYRVTKRPDTTADTARR